MAFSKKRAVKGAAKKFKKLPGNVKKQLPNAALIGVGGAGGAVVRAAGRAVVKRAAKKAAKKNSFKLKGQNKRVRVIRRDR